MANRFSEVNNCPNCQHRLWLRKVRDRRFYNCLTCGYEAEIENPQPKVPHQVSVRAEQLELLFADDAEQPHELAD